MSYAYPIHMEIKIKHLNTAVKLPSYAHPGDVGMDMYATEGATIEPGKMHHFYCGFALEFPEGYAAIVKDKSSLSCKQGLHCIGGVFDAGYRGEYNAMLVNLSDVSVTIEAGQKVAQLVIIPVVTPTLIPVENLSDSARGEGGFGSTGKF